MDEATPIKVLLVVDTHKWAWGRMARGIQKYAPSRYHVDVCNSSEFGGKYVPGDYDAICQFSWMEAGTKWRKSERWSTLVASHGVEFYLDETDEQIIPHRIINTLRNRERAEERLIHFDSVLCVNRKLYRLVEEISGNAELTLPGVDCELFRRRKWPKEALVVGWCGQKAGTTKGYQEVLEPLMELLPDINWKLNIRNAETALDDHQMADWYNDIDVLISTSCSEGCQMPILEAHASERPVIATDVGAAKDSGVKGKFLVDAYQTKRGAEGTLNQIANVLKLLDRKECMRIGKKCRRYAGAVLSWGIKADVWLRIIAG